jgi:hypothetical protein
MRSDFAYDLTNWFAPANPSSRSLIRSVPGDCYTEGESRIPLTGEAAAHDQRRTGVSGLLITEGDA